MVNIGMAAPDSGFPVGDLKRKELYEKGEFRPHVSFGIWPRRAVLDWVRRHPESEQP